MEKKHSIFSYLSQVFMIYGISNILLNIFALIFGENAKSFSSIFSLGNRGIETDICFQFLIAMFIVVGIEYLFGSDFMVKALPSVLRIILIFGISIGVIVAFILIFDWFPKDEILPWILFSICFLISFGLSVIISSAYERSENKKMAEALKRYKEEK